MGLYKRPKSFVRAGRRWLQHRSGAPLGDHYHTRIGLRALQMLEMYGELGRGVRLSLKGIVHAGAVCGSGYSTTARQSVPHHSCQQGSSPVVWGLSAILFATFRRPALT